MESKHSNEWCRVLEIEVPRLPALRPHRDAVPFSLFLMALLERGKPMTLAQVAARFEEAQISPYADALLALQRKPFTGSPLRRLKEQLSFGGVVQPKFL